MRSISYTYNIVCAKARRSSGDGSTLEQLGVSLSTDL